MLWFQKQKLRFLVAELTARNVPISREKRGSPPRDPMINGPLENNV
jgi:hypothetical protein